MPRLPSGARRAAAQETAGFSAKTVGSAYNVKRPDARQDAEASGVFVKNGGKYPAGPMAPPLDFSLAAISNHTILSRGKASCSASPQGGGTAFLRQSLAESDFAAQIQSALTVRLSASGFAHFSCVHPVSDHIDNKVKRQRIMVLPAAWFVKAQPDKHRFDNIR